MLGKRTGSAWMIAGAALMAAGILLHRAERHAHGHRREAPDQEHAPNPDKALLTAVYAATLGAGLLSLQSPQEPIGDPWFSILEIVIILTMSPMVAMMAAVHAWAHAEAKVSGFACCPGCVFTTTVDCGMRKSPCVKMQ